MSKYQKSNVKAANVQQSSSSSLEIKPFLRSLLFLEPQLVFAGRRGPASSQLFSLIPAQTSQVASLMFNHSLLDDLHHFVLQQIKHQSLSCALLLLYFRTPFMR